MPNYVLEKMMEFEGELTWERYLEFAYLGDPPTPGPDNDFLVEVFSEGQPSAAYIQHELVQMIDTAVAKALANAH